MINVLCLKWGGRYGPEYVNRLYRAVCRHLRPSRFVFTCITDDKAGLLDPIVVLPILDPGLEGWWHKMTIFCPTRRFSMPVLYIDLDTVILGDLTPLADLAEGTTDIWFLSDFYWPGNLATGIMVLPEDVGCWIYADWIEHKCDLVLAGGDQDALREIFRRYSRPWGMLQEHLPGQIVSYKVDCCSGQLPGQVRRGSPPAAARVVCFHGVPKPHQVEDLPWISANWKELA